ncbi:hypothetical protein [Paenibacillus cremeus]|uniref:Uncharacterized protein n=1 Tax=Paenibacillus cremeus TaxID=2163881 RepID=A0A559K0G1_9BACL|nr:hypothetical protein [Paenibacillus cremeus]TVY05618.1 hypothetical protein FPZ49_29005 [Paenibacillus cremeus]
MRIKWTRHIATAVLSTSLLALTGVYVNADEAPAVPASPNYHLTDAIKAEVKSVLNEQTPNGTRLGAVVRLYNQGSRITAVPEDEVRVRTDDGVEYALRPSTANAKAIMPKEKVELSYLAVVDREDPFTLSKLSWLDVDPYVYPRTEKLDLSIPIPSMEWHGDSADISNPSSIKTWEQSFTIPGLSNAIQYKPINILKQNTPQGPASVLTLLAENKGTTQQSIPDFRIDGKSATKVYNGKKVEKDAIRLEAGEKQYIHFAIPTQDKDELKSLNVLTLESFTADNQNVSYAIGRLNILLPDNAANLMFNQAEIYKKDTPISFDPLNKLIPANVNVLLEELQMHGSGKDGYKAVVAKFKLLNNSDQPKPIPNFSAELTNSSGYGYSGTRQSLGLQTLIPGINYVIYYTFVVPGSESGEQLMLKILDGVSAAPFNIPIAAIRTQIQSSPADDDLVFYPFHVKVNDFNIARTYTMGTPSYSNKLTMDMTISQDKAIVDPNFSKMRVEVSDKEGKLLGSQAFSLAGDNRLGTGDPAVTFSSDQLVTALTVKIYETIDTPYGEAKRLLKTMQY